VALFLVVDVDLGLQTDGLDVAVGEGELVLELLAFLL
jgi:hypothetical protein